MILRKLTEHNHLSQLQAGIFMDRKSWGVSPS
jgi:hypothetical protein